jgi:hypothetical protein
VDVKFSDAINSIEVTCRFFSLSISALSSGSTSLSGLSRAGDFAITVMFKTEVNGPEKNW